MDSQKEVFSTMLGGATSGFFGRLMCHPLDTCKARIQAPPSFGYQTTSVWKSFRTTFANEGFAGLYRGIGVVTVGGVPGACMYFTSYEYSKAVFSDPSNRLSKYPQLCHFTAGMIAEAFCCILFVPVDVVKERMQIQSQASATTPGAVFYKNSIDAVKTIARVEGLRGIYRGYAATLLSFGPFSALYFTFYEEFKLAAGNLAGIDVTKPSFEASLICSSLAGGLASFLTSPLDLAKLRLQVDRSKRRDASMSAFQSSEYATYKSFYDVLKKTFVNEGGLRGLYRGAFARVAFHVPNTAVTMALFERSKQWWLDTL